MYDALIMGGGAAGMSCALVLGSAYQKEFAKDKKVGLIAHQRTSHLQTALFNNVSWITSENYRRKHSKKRLQQLEELYPHVDLIQKEKSA